MCCFNAFDRKKLKITDWANRKNGLINFDSNPHRYVIVL